MEHPKKEDLVSYTNSGSPSLTVIYKSGRRMSWPHYLLGMSEYRPPNFDEEGTTGREMEGLRVNAGEELVIILGYDLLPIFQGNSEGQGAVLTELGPRHSGLRVKGKPYIAEIQIKKLRNDNEEAKA